MNAPGGNSYVDVLYQDVFSCAKQDNIINTGFNPLRGVNVPPVVTTPTPPTVSQNNPNPFVDETTIYYTLPDITRAELIVRDILTGRVVKQVSLNLKAASVQVSATGLRPGIYVYCVVADGVAVATRRLLIGR